jgi:hypothetical protein
MFARGRKIAAISMFSPWTAQSSQSGPVRSDAFDFIEALVSIGAIVIFFEHGPMQRAPSEISLVLGNETRHRGNNKCGFTIAKKLVGTRRNGRWRIGLAGLPVDCAGNRLSRAAMVSSAKVPTRAPSGNNPRQLTLAFAMAVLPLDTPCA